MIKARWKAAVAGAILGLALHFASESSSIAATTNAAPATPPPGSPAAWKQEDEWYSHVEAEAKAGRGRAQVPALITMIDGSDSQKRETAAQLLSVIGKDADEAVPSLIRHINDPDFFPRLRCIEALGDIGPDAAPAVPDLIKALDDPYYPIANMAAWTLGEIGPKAAEAAPQLEFTILHRPKNSNYYAMVAVTCRVALARITGKPEPQVIALIAMLNELDDETHYSLPALEATRALEELMPDSKIALPDLCRELINPKVTSTTRAAVAEDLRIFGDLRAVPALVEAAKNDPDFTVRSVAIDALGKIKGVTVNIALLRSNLTADEVRAEEHKRWLAWWMSWLSFK